MGINVKVAVLISFALTGAMCWLVNQVASPLAAAQRPLVTLPRTSEVQAPLPAAAPASRPISDQLAYSDVVAPALLVADPPAERLLTLVALQPPSAADEPLAPLYTPGAPGEPEPAAAHQAAPAPSPEPEIPAVSTASPIAGRVSPGATEHKVVRGESLSAIAKRHLGSAAPEMLAALMAANPAVKRRGGMVWADETLVIPDLSRGPGFAKARSGSGSAAAPGARGLVAAAPKRADAAQPARVRRGVDEGSRGKQPGAKMQVDVAARAAAQREAEKVAAGKAAAAKAVSEKAADKRKSVAVAAKPGKQELRLYTVRAGETLAGIAARLLRDEKRWRELARLNGIKDGKILTGMTLKLPAEDA